MAQVADEENEFPAIVVLFFVRMAPGRHARETDAVLDDVADLAIGKILRLWRAQIRRLGVEVPADLGLAAAVVAVTNNAAVREVCALRGIDRFRTVRATIFSRVDGSSVALKPWRIRTAP